MSLTPTNKNKELANDASKLPVAIYERTTQSGKKKKVNVLDEDTFLTKLEQIIEKDFFPDLEKLKLQQAYHEAVRNNDYDTVRELISKYDKLRSEEETPKSPAFFETPNFHKQVFNKSNDEKPYANSEPPTLSKISVDKYLSQNTSEDNVSFEGLMAESSKKEQSKIINQWLFEKEKLHKLKYTSSLELQEDDHQDDITKSIDSWPYKAKNTLMYNPEGAALTTTEELAQSKLKVREIKHSNTRFNTDILKSLRKNTQSTFQTPGSDDSMYQNNTINVITKIGVDGKEQTSINTPKVKGYGFVDASPSPVPGRSFGDESPMMTWGEIDSTPFRLEGPTTPHFSKIQGAPEFKMPDVPDREKLLFDLEEKNNAARRKKKNEALKHVQRNLASPSRKTPTLADKISNMSPAAQSLLSSKLNVKTPKSSVRSSPYTPVFGTPKSSPFNINSSPSPRIRPTSNQSIENLKSNLKRGSNSERSTDSITDNLLKLPKMP